MKKLIVLAGLILAMAHTAFAEQRGVLMEIHNKSNPEKNMEVNRSPMHLSIEVIYDSDTHKIEVAGNESLEVEVFLYNTNGTLEDYSSTLNTDFAVLTPGTYIIRGGGCFANRFAYNKTGRYSGLFCPIRYENSLSMLLSLDNRG